MTWDLALDIIFDALKDSLLVLSFVFIIHVILSFIEDKLSSLLTKRKQTGPLFGSLFGLIPQCGTSVLGADLFIKKHISMGALIAIFLSCSDEAFIAILASGNIDKIKMLIPLIGIKFVTGVLIGMVVDLFFKKQDVKDLSEHVHSETCRVHHIENTPVHVHLVHPLYHSLEIFAYVLVINLVLGFTIGFIGEERFISFVQMNKYLSPLFASIIGLIPNCASSLLLSELFIDGSLSFGALLSGLLVNAGLGFVVLVKNKSTIKKVIPIILICFITAVIVGYIYCLIFGF